MNADEKTQRDAGSIHTDQIGKVFAARRHGLLECLVCGGLFTRTTAPEHAEVDCYPSIEFCLLEPAQGGKMSLSKKYVRDGNRKIIGSVTSGYSDTSAVVRDEHHQIAGRTSERFDTTRDGRGNLISINSADPGLLIGRKK